MEEIFKLGVEIFKPGRWLVDVFPICEWPAVRRSPPLLMSSQYALCQRGSRVRDFSGMPLHIAQNSPN